MLCQTMFTGLNPHRSGSMDFFPVKPELRAQNADYGFSMLEVSERPSCLES